MHRSFVLWYKGRNAAGDCREKVHLKHQQATEVKGRGGGKPKDMSKKAILLSGPPGIGKTSSAMIISRCALVSVSTAQSTAQCATRCLCCTCASKCTVAAAMLGML